MSNAGKTAMCRPGTATQAPSKGLQLSASGSSTLKASEKQLAAPRVWHRLVGFAKSVVRNLDPTAYSTQNGLDKLLEVLRRSPLQRLPVPDTFQRLERWSGLHRRQGESIPQFLVREEELFVELQQSLIRARSVKGKDQKVIIAEEPPPDEGEEEEAAETEEKDDDKDGRRELKPCPATLPVLGE